MSDFERLSVLDASMLSLEDRDCHMHIGSVATFEAGPLWKEEGGLEIDTIRESVLARLHKIPRYRQRVEYTPIEHDPIWVDDTNFNISYHGRHTALPLGAGDRELKRLTGRILSQALDRGKPLWEMWFIEGLEDDRFALITKIHHAMVDGIAGVEVMHHLLSDHPNTPVEPAHPWIAKPHPRDRDLLVSSLLRRPLALLRDARHALADPQRTLDFARDAIAGTRQIVRTNMSSASETPFNERVGPHRRFDWTKTPLDDVREIKQCLGGTVNDVVLAVVAGAVGTFLESRNISLDGLDFRVAVPVSTRKADQQGESAGNRTSMMPTPLPIAERNPVARLQRVIETTRGLKDSKLTLVPDVLEKVCEWTFPALFAEFARFGSSARSFNIVVTNVPGPPSAVFLHGARQLSMYPAVPFFSEQSLAIGILSY
ncbi:MAG: wax ester/triacylglycerol synthase family O-acyltransferase, partial [bacterium]|nr:wax ester/triacylglycerol synthase family O-acyltransferase [bacterium]